DNRRPVEYELRRRLLASGIDPASAWPRQADSGLPKLLLTQRALQLRQRMPAAFGSDSTYEPLEVRSDHSAKVVAFLRSGAEGAAVTVVPRLTLNLSKSDSRQHERAQGERTQRLGEVLVPAGEWRSELTDVAVDGGWVGVGELLADLPVALLSREGAV
ncbi:MAG: hypothetical protein JO176_00025, partial [Acidimicrobiia bacterium]|nr:hypothetical protein [Acidimicrobiia bacterium]